MIVLYLIICFKQKLWLNFGIFQRNFGYFWKFILSRYDFFQTTQILTMNQDFNSLGDGLLGWVGGVSKCWCLLTWWVGWEGQMLTWAKIQRIKGKTYLIYNAKKNHIQGGYREILMCADKVDEWGLKRPKTCWRDIWMVPQILRRREMAHLFQWYYPEGGWGWIILLCAFLSQTLAQGLQVRFDKIL